MKNFAYIFARGGSKGLPNKNIKPLGGIPLIAHSILLAKEVKQNRARFTPVPTRTNP